MDTWATSSLTPQIAGGWLTDDDLWQRVYPFDLCTQAHEIIRTWLFSRVVRSHFEERRVPWSHAMKCTGLSMMVSRQISTPEI